jgi:hypothetical protein
MASYFSVLQYVPRPSADERINFGVVCFSDNEVRARIVSDWARIERFSRRDVRFLKDFATRLHEATRRIDAAGAAPLPAEWTRTDLERMAKSWSHSIQLTEPRASLLGVPQLLESIYLDFIDEPTRRATPARGRRDARLGLRILLQDALGAFVDKKVARSLLKRGKLDGRAEVHPFDAILGNGHPYLVAQALSFEADATLPSDDFLRSLAFRIEDVNKLQPDLPFAIYALPPNDEIESEQTHERFDHARTIFDSVGAAVVPENDFPGFVAPFVTGAVGQAVA